MFNTFVMLQLFNFLNARKINDEVIYKFKIDKCFRGHFQQYVLYCHCGNYLSFAGNSCHLCRCGLRSVLLLWLASNSLAHFSTFYFIQIAIGSLSIIVSIVLKLIPSKIFPQKGKEEADVARPHSSAISMRRRSSRTLREINYNVLQWGIVLVR